MGVVYSTSWVELCNQALGRLGKGSIADLTEGTQLANYCSLYLGQAIEEIYGLFDWTAGRARAQLNQLVTTPTYGPLYYYQLPVDFIRPFEVDAGGEDYTTEDDKIATDAEEVYLTYLARPSDPAKLAPYIKKMISTRLAFLLSTPLTSSETLASRLAQEDQLALTEAIAADARRAQKDASEPFYGASR
jgi:hypothetical protein